MSTTTTLSISHSCEMRMVRVLSITKMLTIASHRVRRRHVALISLRGRHLRNKNILPFTKFRSDFTDISFCLDFPDLDVDLTLPRWSVHKLPPAEPVKRLARVGLFQLAGTYHYFTELREENIEQLTLNLTVSRYFAAMTIALNISIRPRKCFAKPLGGQFATS